MTSKTVEALWGEKTRGRRGPVPTLSTATVVAAATKLADREGLGAVSMERIARELGFTAMSLYRHVPGKTELVALMVDSAIGPPPAGRGRGWRARLEAWAEDLWAGLHARPWTLEATGRLRVMGPNELAWFEAALATLEATALTPRERQAACLTVVAHVRGLAHFSISAQRGMSGARWESITRRILKTRADQFPHLGSVLGAGAPPLDAFAFGLACILDGIERRVVAKRRPVRGARRA